MQLDLHAPERSPRLRSLADYRKAIEGEVSGVALRVGLLLRQAKEAHPGRFTKWVETELPFGKDVARRMMAISKAFETLPAATLEQLPKPWQAMYALRHVPKDQLVAGVARGELGPSTSILDAQHFARTGTSIRPRLHRAEVAAGVLLNFEPSDLDPEIRRALLTWLVGPLTVDELGPDLGATAAEE